MKWELMGLGYPRATFFLISKADKQQWKQTVSSAVPRISVTAWTKICQGFGFPASLVIENFSKSPFSDYF